MGKEEILDYVRNTPGNTNPSVLKGMLRDVAGESGGGVLMIEAEFNEDIGAVELTATWQEICDAVNSGKLVAVHSYSIDSSGSGMFMHKSDIAYLVAYRTGVSRPYIVQFGDGSFDCEAPDEHPYMTVDDGPN